MELFQRTSYLAPKGNVAVGSLHCPKGQCGGPDPPGDVHGRRTKNLNFGPKLAEFGFETLRIRYSKLVRRSLSCSRPNPWGSNPVLSRLKINVHEDRRTTFLNRVRSPAISLKIWQNEAEEHSSLGSKDEVCSSSWKLKRAV